MNMYDKTMGWLCVQFFLNQVLIRIMPNHEYWTHVIDYRAILIFKINFEDSNTVRVMIYVCKSLAKNSIIDQISFRIHLISARHK